MSGLVFPGYSSLVSCASPSYSYAKRRKGLIKRVTLRGLVQSPCKKINVIMMLGGRGPDPALSADFSVIMHSCD